MRNIIIFVAVFMTCALTMAGCAFDKLNLSVDKGAAKLPIGGTSVIE